MERRGRTVGIVATALGRPSPDHGGIVASVLGKAVRVAIPVEGAFVRPGLYARPWRLVPGRQVLSVAIVGVLKLAVCAVVSRKCRQIIVPDEVRHARGSTIDIVRFQDRMDDMIWHDRRARRRLRCSL